MSHHVFAPRFRPFVVLLVTLALFVSIPIIAPLSAYAVTFTGTVTAEEGGAPIVGASVRILRVVGATVEIVDATTTGAGGTYTVDIPATIVGDLVVDVSAPPNFRTEVENLDVVAGVVQNPAAGNVQLGNVNLMPIITGGVAPAAATSGGMATVTVERLLGTVWEVFDVVPVNSLGAYQIFDSLPADTDAEPLPGAGSFRLSASAPGYATSAPTPVSVSRPEGEARIATPNVVNFSLEIRPAPVGADVTRVAGADRFMTAIEVSKKAFPGPLDPLGDRTVVIATGRNWPDALGGSALAGVVDGPILLVDTNTIPAAVTAEITRLGAQNAIILGGTAAVGTAVETALNAQLDGVVTRLGGATRYVTAGLIRAEVISRSGAAFGRVAFIATGADFPDALAAAPMAASMGWPIYLVQPGTSIPPALFTQIDSAIILGGTAAVAAAALEAQLVAELGLANVVRRGGLNRYETAVAVATHAVAEGHTWDRVGIATGENFPDALTGGVLQARMGSVMLLSTSNALRTETRTVLEQNKGVITSGILLGGPDALGDTVKQQVEAALTD